jgi:hypothetical protein
MTALLTRLHRFIAENYDQEELRTLCFDLQVRYDDLRGEGLSARARELVLWLGRRHQLDRLLAQLAQLRPDTFADAGLSTGPETVDGLY